MKSMLSFIQKMSGIGKVVAKKGREWHVFYAEKVPS